MSYTCITVFTHNTPTPDTLPVAQLKVGDEVYAYVDRQEGDDGDYHGFRMVTIKSITICESIALSPIALEFDGVYPNDDVIVRRLAHIEISGKITVRELD